MDGDRSIAAVFSSSLGVKLLILVTEAMEKRDILLPRYQQHPPEATSGIYSRSFFWWLNSLFSSGFRRSLSNDDLYPIDDSMISSVLQDRLQIVWNASKKETSHALLWSTMKALRGPLGYCIFPRLCLTGFRYAQPFLIARTIRFINTPDEPDNIGWGLTAAYGFVFLGRAVANGSYYHMVYRFITSLRGSLVGIIYSKTVDLSITAMDESAAVTLMSTDTETICLAFVQVHEIWAVPIETGLALWLLQRQVGFAFLAVAMVATIGVVTTIWLSRFMGKAQKRWIQAIQTRIDTTASMLGSMKAVKMLGFTDILASMVQGLRVSELNLSGLFRRLTCVRVFLGKAYPPFRQSVTHDLTGNSIILLGPLATFTVYVLIANVTGIKLDTTKAYTSLSLIALLADPLNIMIYFIPQFVGAMACFDRIQAFLKSEARRDHRLLLDQAAEGDCPGTMNGPDIEPKSMPRDAVVSGRTPVGSSLIEVQNASFAWSIAGQPVVQDVSFTIKRFQFTFVIGPVGSGKSTLLKGLLGETPSSQGFVHSGCFQTAYAEQTSWIRNGTIQHNILGISSFEEPWYTTVIRACALEQDILNLPKGHSTLVGSAGISLSGGQKQRLAIARAVYSRKSLIMLDDVFSGLDASTEETIFNRLLGKQGLLRKSQITVILVTHAGIVSKGNVEHNFLGYVDTMRGLMLFSLTSAIRRPYHIL